MDIPIIFEDQDMVVINKPAGVVVNRADTSVGETIQDWSEDKFSISNFQFSTDEEFKSRGGIVHRLDKDTSGVLVIAKNVKSFLFLKTQFQERVTVKKYWALVHGKVEPSSGTINAPIQRNPFNRMHFGIFPGGREAETQYKTIFNFQFSIFNSKEEGTLLEVTPKTGRTHQIRVHMKHINHPVVGDPLYAGRKNLQKDLTFCPRMFLHAKELTIARPSDEKPMTFRAELPSQLQKVLDLLKMKG